MRIAVLGAECTGKTQLCQALVHAWVQCGQAAVAVPEMLRSWCAHAGRTPQAHEQAQIAHDQAEALALALVSLSPLATTKRALLVSDTSALMTAVYSDVLFDDASLYPWALAQQRQFDYALLMGLDLPWVADGIQRDGPAVQAQIDARLRKVLDRHGVTYTTVYGTGQKRVACALQAINHHWDAADAPTRRTASNWQWSCEKCSDAGCEHQLFSALLRADSMRH